MYNLQSSKECKMHLMKNGKKKKKQVRDIQTNRHIWKLKL